MGTSHSCFGAITPPHVSVCRPVRSTACLAPRLSNTLLCMPHRDSMQPPSSHPLQAVLAVCATAAADHGAPLALAAFHVRRSTSSKHPSFSLAAAAKVPTPSSSEEENQLPPLQQPMHSRDSTQRSTSLATRREHRTLSPPRVAFKPSSCKPRADATKPRRSEGAICPRASGQLC